MIAVGTSAIIAYWLNDQDPELTLKVQAEEEPGEVQGATTQDQLCLRVGYSSNAKELHSQSTTRYHSGLSFTGPAISLTFHFC